MNKSHKITLLQTYEKTLSDSWWQIADTPYTTRVGLTTIRLLAAVIWPSLYVDDDMHNFLNTAIGIDPKFDHVKSESILTLANDIWIDAGGYIHSTDHDWNGEIASYNVKSTKSHALNDLKFQGFSRSGILETAQLHAMIKMKLAVLQVGNE